MGDWPTGDWPADFLRVDRRFGDGDLLVVAVAAAAAAAAAGGFFFAAGGFFFWVLLVGSGLLRFSLRLPFVAGAGLSAAIATFL